MRSTSSQQYFCDARPITDGGRSQINVAARMGYSPLSPRNAPFFTGEFIKAHWRMLKSQCLKISSARLSKQFVTSGEHFDSKLNFFLVRVPQFHLTWQPYSVDPCNSGNTCTTLNSCLYKFL